MAKLPLLITRIPKFFGKAIQIAVKEMKFDALVSTNLQNFSVNSPQNLCTWTLLYFRKSFQQPLPMHSEYRIFTFMKVWKLWPSYLRVLKMSDINFSIADPENLMQVCLIQPPSISSAFTNCLMIPSLIRRRDKTSMNCSTRGVWMFFNTRYHFFSFRPSFFVQCWYLSLLFHRRRKHGNSLQSTCNPTGIQPEVSPESRQYGGFKFAREGFGFVQWDLTFKVDKNSTNL